MRRDAGAETHVRNERADSAKQAITCSRNSERRQRFLAHRRGESITKRCSQQKAIAFSQRPALLELAALLCIKSFLFLQNEAAFGSKTSSLRSIFSFSYKPTHALQDWFPGSRRYFYFQSVFCSTSLLH